METSPKAAAEAVRPDGQSSAEADAPPCSAEADQSTTEVMDTSSVKTDPSAAMAADPSNSAQTDLAKASDNSWADSEDYLHGTGRRTSRVSTTSDNLSFVDNQCLSDNNSRNVSVSESSELAAQPAEATASSADEPLSDHQKLRLQYLANKEGEDSPSSGSIPSAAHQL